ncbi:MAG TPA: DUF839 domain-containing protein, partial [Myxococcota bacterium]|nr:DUF839 domain-containing protein [Myxococcota bacterium]
VAGDLMIAEKHAFANVSVEGFDFSIAEPNVAYYVDEDNSGSIYKLVASDDTFDAGQTFVLSVDDFAGNPVANWNAADVRTGLATWVPITDADGNPLTPTDPFVVTPGNPRPGRLAANEVGGTPYGRPEDTAVARQRNGNEVLYFTATSENAVYSVEMLDAGRAIVRLFASEATTPKNVGFAGTTARLNSPDNLALDAVGNLYVIEDAPNGDVVGGDIWFARDADNDGVAESLDHFLSLQVNGAESTGMVFDPVNPTQFVVAVQHPTTTGLAGGQGDALWLFDIADVVPPTCQLESRGTWWSWVGGWAKTCSSDRDFNFIEKLERTVRRGGNHGHGYGHD